MQMCQLDECGKRSFLLDPLNLMKTNLFTEITSETHNFKHEKD